MKTEIKYYGKILLTSSLFFFHGIIAVYAQNTQFEKLQEKYESGAIYLTSGPLMDLFSLNTSSETKNQLASLPGGTNLPLLFSFILRIGGTSISNNISFLKIDLMRKKAAYISPENNQGNLIFLNWDEEQVEDIAIWIDNFLTFSYSVYDFSLSLKNNPPTNVEFVWSTFNDLKGNVLATVHMENLLNYEIRNYIDSSNTLEFLKDSDSTIFKSEIRNFIEKYDKAIFNEKDKLFDKEKDRDIIE